MKFFISLIALTSLITADDGSITVTSPKKGDVWNASKPLKVTWTKEGLDDSHKWVEVRIINAKDSGIEWKFDYVTSLEENNTFYIPTQKFIEGSDYQIYVGAYPDGYGSLIDVIGTSETFSITNGVNFDDFKLCDGDWKIGNFVDKGPIPQASITWSAPSKNPSADLLDLRIKGVDDPNFTYTTIDNGSKYVNGTFDIFTGFLEDGKKYKVQGIFHYDRRITAGEPLCNLESEVFSYKKFIPNM